MLEKKGKRSVGCVGEMDCVCWVWRDDGVKERRCDGVAMFVEVLAAGCLLLEVKRR